MFNKMNWNIAVDVSKTLLHVAFRPNPDAEKASEENMSNVTPDKEEIDRSNPQAKIN